MNSSINGYLSKCDQTAVFWNWSHLPKKSLMDNFHFLCSVVCYGFTDISVTLTSVKDDVVKERL